MGIIFICFLRFSSLLISNSQCGWSQNNWIRNEHIDLDQATELGEEDAAEARSIGFGREFSFHLHHDWFS
jgi:hypothetical protein